MFATRAIALAFLLIAAAPAAAKKPEAAEPPPAPALWRISDADSTAYLFGAIGLAPGGASWRSRALSQAIDRSETVWLEASVDEPSAQAAANAIFTEQGMAAHGETLSRMLPGDAAAALPAIAEKTGLSMAALEPLKPWAAFVILSSRLGPETDEKTIDAALLAEARGRGRQFRYFTAVEDSLRILTDLPAAGQAALAAELIGDFDRQRDEARDGFSAWRRGDLDGVDAYFNAGLRARSPEIYALLVSGRVEALAEGFDAVMKTPGSSFVALNPAYLAGPDALPGRLAARGYKVERVGE